MSYRFVKIFFFLIFLWNFSQSTFSQEKQTKKDSIEKYHKIKKLSEKSKFTNFLRKIIFKPAKIKKRIKH